MAASAKSLLIVQGKYYYDPHFYEDLGSCRRWGAGHSYYLVVVRLELRQFDLW